MKKNIVGHMSKPRESAGSVFRSLHLLQRLLCLLLALLLWLCVFHLSADRRGEQTDDSVRTEQSA